MTDELAATYTLKLEERYGYRGEIRTNYHTCKCGKKYSH